MNGKSYRQQLREAIAAQVAHRFSHLPFEQRAEMAARLLEDALAPTEPAAKPERQQPDHLAQEAWEKAVE